GENPGATEGAVPHRVPFVRECGQGHAPALTRGSQSSAVGHFYAVEEDLVEGGASGHLPKRPHGHPGRMHVDEEGGEVVVAWPRRRLADDLADVRQVRSGRPHLLAGDEPAIAVGDRPGPDRCEVRSGARFTEQLAG